ncbi:hypothetical protein RHSIM_Rhsim04G0103900 [Rhododendron simsii]|uniref:Uncharacterized protein n=1 Tax=Rhododendron simsii TaxID=118357 RepID=A0A834GZW3_RHOSS|nr:hypothetical protein RHSIM_Rhsim04G0103900 [Rhododendron simsii]
MTTSLYITPVIGQEFGPISKVLNTNSREKANETLLAQVCRHAPTLLEYKPSYKGVLRGRKRIGDGESSKAAQKQKPSDPIVQKKKKAPAQTDEPGPKRQRGVKLPRIGYSVEEWLTPLGADETPLSAEEMSRRNIPRPVIPTKSANLARARGSSEEQNKQGDKRQKTSADALQSPPVNQPPTEKVASPPKEKGVDIPARPHIDLTDPETEAAILWHFSPSYTMPDGRVLLMKDSVKEEPNLAVTLLRGLALPRDYDQVPPDLMPGLGEMCSHLVQAGQAALKAYDKASKVSAE